MKIRKKGSFLTLYISLYIRILNVVINFLTFQTSLDLRSESHIISINTVVLYSLRYIDKRNTHMFCKHYCVISEFYTICLFRDLIF